VGEGEEEDEREDDEDEEDEAEGWSRLMLLLLLCLAGLGCARPDTSMGVKKSCGEKALPVPAPGKKAEREGRERLGAPCSGRNSGEKGRAHPERRSSPEREGRLDTGAGIGVIVEEEEVMGVMGVMGVMEGCGPSLKPVRWGKKRRPCQGKICRNESMRASSIVRPKCHNAIPPTCRRKERGKGCKTG